MQNGLCEFVIVALSEKNMTLLTPVLRTINKIMAGN